MNQEQRLSEITRLRNFRAGLEKQVSHFLELERQLMSEYILATSEYKVGQAVIADIKPDYKYEKGVPFICKITNIEPDFYKPYDNEKKVYLPETVRLKYTVLAGALSGGYNTSYTATVLEVRPLDPLTTNPLDK